MKKTLSVCWALFIYITFSLNVWAQTLTPAQQETLRNLTPEQKQAIQQELQKTGGVLTPEAIEALKRRPEFKGLTPEEIIKGKKLLETKEKLLEQQKEKGLEEEKKATLKKKKITAPKEITSLFQRYLRIKSGALKVSTNNLRPFGYNLFRRIPTKTLPAQPVAPDYIIGPGDEIQVLLWGRINAQYNLQVGRDGRILFPQIGPLTVAGMKYSEMKDFLTKQATRIIGANVAITLSKLRQIQVFVLGEVRNPGPYNLTAMSTMLDALIVAGGPTGRGSLRRIILKRNNKVISVLDLYDLLLKGDKSKDKRLRHGDIIFVPLAGPLVGIAGNVKRPAIYELKTESNLEDALKLAGGLLPVAWEQKIQVERAEKHEWKVVLDINAKNKKKLRSFKLQDGDLIKVFSIIPQAINTVELLGNVARPGTYAYHPGMCLKEIITNPGDLLPDTYFEYALIKRYVWPTGETKLVPFNLRKVILEKKENIELKPLDKVYIFSKWFFESKPSVSIKGEVRNPGTYQIPEKGFRVKDVILLAGGLKKDAYLGKAELYRLDKKNKKTILLTFNLKKAMEGDPAHNLLLKDLDEIVIHSIWEYIPKQTVSIYGEVNKPGQYPFAPGMRVKDLVFAGGNVKESAYLKEAEITRYEIKNGKICESEHICINLERALAGDPKDNILLKPYDQLFVRKISDWGHIAYVEISGEVRFPGKYAITKGERLSSLIERAGGFTEKAYLRGAVFIRKRVQELQQRQINEMIDRLEKELMGASVAKVGAALTPQEAGIKEKETELKRQFLNRLRKIKAKGRLVIHLAPPERLKGTPYDIELEDGDKLYVPTNPRTVQVVGAVFNQTAFIYMPGKDLSYYIDAAGGYTKNADKKYIYILKVDGSAVRPGKGWSISFRWNPITHRWESGNIASTIEPGDTIVVPEKLEKVAWLKNIKDITQILYQIAITAGVTIAAY